MHLQNLRNYRVDDRFLFQLHMWDILLPLRQRGTGDDTAVLQTASSVPLSHMTGSLSQPSEGTRINGAEPKIPPLWVQNMLHIYPRSLPCGTFNYSMQKRIWVHFECHSGANELARALKRQ